MSLPSLNNLDKSTWQRLPFGEIAQSIGERVDPTSTDLETYVGLEHIDPESIHIKRFGKREDVSGQKLRCYPGDVIFGRRRAYQRKAAICEFDGFCSAHSLVLRAIPEVIDPKLFPFFLHSDQFMHRAVDISVGGLSPTINWTKLKKEEFLFPPKNQQAIMAELLWAADEVVMRLNYALATSKTTVASKLQELFGKSKSRRNESFDLKKLSECVHVQTGVAKGKKPKNGEKFASHPYLRVANVQDGYLNLDEIKEISLPEKDIEKYLLEDGDVVICEGGDFDKVGRGAIWRDHVSPCLHQNHVFCLRCDRSQILPEFLELQIQSNYGKGYFLGCAKKTSNLASINSTQVKDFPLQVADLERQQDIVDEFRLNHKVTTATNSQLKISTNLLKVLISQIFQPI